MNTREQTAYHQKISNHAQAHHWIKVFTDSLGTDALLKAYKDNSDQFFTKLDAILQQALAIKTMQYQPVLKELSDILHQLIIDEPDTPLPDRHAALTILKQLPNTADRSSLDQLKASLRAKSTRYFVPKVHDESHRAFSDELYLALLLKAYLFGEGAKTQKSDVAYHHSLPKTELAPIVELILPNTHPQMNVIEKADRCVPYDRGVTFEQAARRVNWDDEACSRHLFTDICKWWNTRKETPITQRCAEAFFLYYLNDDHEYVSLTNANQRLDQCWEYVEPACALADCLMLIMLKYSAVDRRFESVNGRFHMPVAQQPFGTLAQATSLFFHGR